MATHPLVSCCLDCALYCHLIFNAVHKADLRLKTRHDSSISATHPLVSCCLDRALYCRLTIGCCSLLDGLHCSVFVRACKSKLALMLLLLLVQSTRTSLCVCVCVCVCVRESMCV